MEVGSVATPFEHRSFGEELALCQRYYELMDRAYIHVYYTNVSIANVFWTEKRANPSFTATENTPSCTLGVIGKNSGYLYKGSSATGAVSGIKLDAEL